MLQQENKNDNMDAKEGGCLNLTQLHHVRAL
jgi:hypothetical protein